MQKAKEKGKSEYQITNKEPKAEGQKPWGGGVPFSIAFRRPAVICGALWIRDALHHGIFDIGDSTFAFSRGSLPNPYE